MKGKFIKIDQATGARNGRVVRGRLFQTAAQKVAQGEGVRRAPRDAAVRIDPFEIANQQQPEVHAWRQARPSHDFRIEWLTLTFDEIIEVVLGQPLIQSRVESVTGGPSENSSSPPKKCWRRTTCQS